MPYEKTVWVPGGPPGISAENLNKIEDGLDAVTDAAEMHAADKNNPHTVTKAQVGLGNVENYGIATQAEALAGTSNVKYMTPLRTAEATAQLKAFLHDMEFGSGKDGDATISSTTTLVRDMHYHNLVVNSGVTLNTANHRIYATGTITINGTIACNACAIPGWFSAGQGGIGVWILSDTSWWAQPGEPGDSVRHSFGGNGGAGGGGFANTKPYVFDVAGGAGGTATRLGGFWNQSSIQLTDTQYISAATMLYASMGGAGGGGGAPGGYDTRLSGGTGGAGGGVVMLIAPTIVHNGSITAIGGSGGNGQVDGSYGSGGGGGGGGGGIILVYKTKSGSGTTNVSGGAGGVGYRNGTAGSAGTVINIQLSEA